MTGKLNVILTALLVASALSLINARNQQRHVFIELESYQQQARQLDIEWAQLQLDQSTLGKNERIEQIAGKDLNMTVLTPARTQYLTEGGK